MADAVEGHHGHETGLKEKRFFDIAEATRRRDRMGAVNIEQSVGFGGRNKPIDVAIIQRLLKAYFTEVATPVKGRSSRVITPSIAVNGECTTGLVDLIKDVQSDDMGVKHPDGRIDPYGKTLQTITSALHCTAEMPRQSCLGQRPETRTFYCRLMRAASGSFSLDRSVKA